MNGDFFAFKKRRNTLDVPAHHFSAHVVWVIVGAERADKIHVVCFNDFCYFVHRISGVDDDAFACLQITDEVYKIDHLVSHLVLLCEVRSREQLTEIQAIIHDFRLPIYDVAMEIS